MNKKYNNNSINNFNDNINMYVNTIINMYVNTNINNNNNIISNTCSYCYKNFKYPYQYKAHLTTKYHINNIKFIISNIKK